LITSATLLERDEVQLKMTEAEVDEFEHELENTEEINEDLRAELELKDKTIRSLVEVCRHLASRTV